MVVVASVVVVGGSVSTVDVVCAGSDLSTVVEVVAKDVVVEVS